MGRDDEEGARRLRHVGGGSPTPPGRRRRDEQGDTGGADGEDYNARTLNAGGDEDEDAPTAPDEEGKRQVQLIARSRTNAVSEPPSGASPVRPGGGEEASIVVTRAPASTVTTVEASTEPEAPSAPQARTFGGRRRGFLSNPTARKGPLGEGISRAQLRDAGAGQENAQ